MADDDESYDGGSPLDTGTLAEIFGGIYGPASPEAQKAALGILQDYQKQAKAGVQPEDEILGKMRASADQVRQALKDARMRLISRGNDKTEALLAISAGLGRPTRFGTIGEAFGNMSESLQPVVRGQEAREKELLGIDTSEASVDNSVNAAEFQLAELKRRLGSAEAIKALEVLRNTGQGRGTQLRDQKIRDTMIQLMQNGMKDPAKAWAYAAKVVDGRVKMDIVPGLGVVRFTDIVNKTAEEVPLDQRTPPGGAGASGGEGSGSPTAAPGGPAASSSAPAEPGSPASGGTQTPVRPKGPSPQQQGTTPLGAASTDPRDVMRPGDMTMWDAAAAGTGLWSGIKNWYNIGAGNVGLPISESTAKARQTLINQAQFMTRVLSVDPSDPSFKEIERIRSDLDLLPSMSNNPQLMRTSINTLDKSLRGLYEKALKDSEDTSLPQDFRSKRQSLAAAIRGFIPVLGAREKAGDVPVPVGMPANVAEVWQYLTPEARARAEKLYGQK